MLGKRSKLDQQLNSEERTIIEVLRYLDDVGSEEDFIELAEEVKEKNERLWDAYKKLS